MNNAYRDIRERIPEEPKWFDEEAVPRYCDFHPQESANIYSQFVVLYLIECQGCHHRFKVAQSSSGLPFQETEEISAEEVQHLNWFFKRWDIAEAVREDRLGYGDPPNVGCCPAGPTMGSIPIMTLEFWRQGGENRGYIGDDGNHYLSAEDFEWQRVPALENVELT